MYDVQILQQAFRGLVALKQNKDPRFDRLSTWLTQSSQNIFVMHPLINIETLDMTARDYTDNNYDEWDAEEVYAEDDNVRIGNTVYVSLVDDNEGNPPASSPTQWEVVSNLSLYLEDQYLYATDDLLNCLTNMKKLRSETKTLLRNLILYEGAGNMHDTMVNTAHDLVGFAVKLKYSKNLVAIIERIGTQFTAAGNVPLLVYHSSQYEPIHTVTLTRTKAYSFQWHELEGEERIKLHHILTNYDAGGTFYIMYDQSTIPGQAVNRKITWGIAPCVTCSAYDRNAFNGYSKYVTIQTVRVKASDRPVDGDDNITTNMWDIEQTSFENGTNFGLNFEFTVRCDLTEMLVRDKEMFAFALRDMYTVKLLESIAYSYRQNSVEEKIKKLAMIALQSKSVGGGGAKEEADKQIKAMDFEFSGFNDYCLPCNNKAGLKFGATRLSFGR